MAIIVVYCVSILLVTFNQNIPVPTCNILRGCVVSIGIVGWTDFFSRGWVPRARKAGIRFRVPRSGFDELLLLNM